MARAPLTRERERELYEDLARARAAATAPMDRRDFRAWARVILIRAELGHAISTYALDCARQAVQAKEAPPTAQPFVAPAERVVMPKGPARQPDDELGGYASILEAAEEDA